MASFLSSCSGLLSQYMPAHSSTMICNVHSDEDWAITYDHFYKLDWIVTSRVARHRQSLSIDRGCHF